eukprot:symbB.v1.2.003492.t1/scaffold198.1/size278664/8
MATGRPSRLPPSKADSRQAVRQLERLQQRRLPLDVLQCNEVLRSFAQGGRWQEGIELIQRLGQWNLKLDAVSLSAIFSAMKKDKKKPWQNAMLLLDSLGVVPDTIAMNGMLPLLPWRYALHSLEEMPKRKLQRDQVTYNAVLKTLENKWQFILEVLNSMPAQRLMPDLANWNTAIKACGTCQQWEWSLHLFQSLPIDPSEVSFISILSALPGSCWSLALRLFQLAMLRKEHSPQNVSWIRSALLQVLANAPGKSAGGAGPWDHALHLLTSTDESPRDFDVASVLKSCMRSGREDLVRPLLRSLNGQRYSFNSLLEEFGQLGQWQNSLDLLSLMIASRVLPDEYTYGLCIGSCNTSGAWQLALRLLGVMPARSLTPQLKTFQVTAGVCAHAGEWQAVLRLAETLEPEESSRVVSWALEVCYLRRHSAAAAALASASAAARGAGAALASRATGIDTEESVRSQYLMAMQTCVACRDWPLVLELFETLPQVRVTTNGILSELLQPADPLKGSKKTWPSDGA